MGIAALEPTTEAAAHGRTDTAAANPALATYEALAPFYDAFTAEYAYERWLGRIERLVRAMGLTGSRVLDVACGTGRSSEPLARRGWDVAACDLSPAMVERARSNLACGDGRVFVADMRSLPPIGPFDLVTCLDDAVNYLLSEDDLAAAFSSIGRVLRPGGMLVFDCNSLHTYRTTFATTFLREGGGAVFWWKGRSRPDFAPGGMASAVVEVLCREPSGGWRCSAVGRHLQRHYPRAIVERSLDASGLRLAAVRGQHTGAQLVTDVDEESCPKVLYVAEKPEQ